MITNIKLDFERNLNHKFKQLFIRQKKLCVLPDESFQEMLALCTKAKFMELSSVHHPGLTYNNHLRVLVQFIMRTKSVTMQNICNSISCSPTLILWFPTLYVISRSSYIFLNFVSRTFFRKQVETRLMLQYVIIVEPNHAHHIPKTSIAPKIFR